MPTYTNLSDKAVRKLGLRDAYVLSLIYRHCQMKDGVFKAGIENKAKSLNLSPNLLRRALRRLLADELICDLTPHFTNQPHEYRTTPKAEKLLFQNGRAKMAGPKWQGQNGRAKMEDKEYSIVGSTTTTTDINKASSSSKQLVLTENHNTQNLGTLDIQAQEHLATLGIQPDLKQSFRSAPELVKNHTPAEVLMFHDLEDQISETLGRWRAAWDDGANITDKPALIWAKIVEGQEPPAASPEPKLSDWLEEVVIT